MKTTPILSTAGSSTQRSALLALVIALAPFASVFGVNFSDTFESGVSGSIWNPWTTGGNDNLITTDGAHNITPGGAQSARVFASDPAAWNGYADFGATSDSLRASVYLYEDYSNNGSNPSQPVTSMLSLYGNSGTGPGAFTDYIQLGVVPFYPGGSATYGFRTSYNDGHGLGILDTHVSRKAGWTKLSIQVDSVATGGQVEFFIDDVLVGSSFRTGVDLRWVRLGNNSKSYENFWYDDVTVVPEPTSLALLGLGGFGLAAFGRRRLSR